MSNSFDNSNSIATSTIRENLRKKIRAQQIQKSFKETRKKLQHQQMKEKLQQEQKQSKLVFNPFKPCVIPSTAMQNQQIIHQQAPLQSHCQFKPQIYNQNLYLNANLKSPNIPSQNESPSNIVPSQQFNINTFNIMGGNLNKINYNYLNSNQNSNDPFTNLYRQILAKQLIRKINNGTYEGSNQIQSNLFNRCQNAFDKDKQRQYCIAINKKIEIDIYRSMSPPQFIAKPKQNVVPKNKNNNNIKNPILSPKKHKQQNFSAKPSYQIKLQTQKYTVYEKLLGSGTYSTVYLGKNNLTKKSVAIKQIKQVQKNEIALLMAVQSPYIIKLEDYWKDYKTKNTYLVLEYCKCNLRQQMEKGISLQKKLEYFSHVVKGMDALFSKNIIHRDLKFENILISHDGFAKIGDFGLAKNLGSMANVASIRCGTPYTMAPQILLNKGHCKPYYNQKCDIWSLGILLHQILYDIHPFNKDQYKVAQSKRVYVFKKFGYLDNLLDKTLVSDPNKRICWQQFKKIYESKQKNIKEQDKIKNYGSLLDSLNFKKKNNLEIPISQVNKIELKKKQIKQQNNNRLQQNQNISPIFNNQIRPQTKFLMNNKKWDPINPSDYLQYQKKHVYEPQPLQIQKIRSSQQVKEQEEKRMQKIRSKQNKKQNKLQIVKQQKQRSKKQSKKQSNQIKSVFGKKLNEELHIQTNKCIKIIANDNKKPLTIQDILRKNIKTQYPDLLNPRVNYNNQKQSNMLLLYSMFLIISVLLGFTIWRMFNK